MITAAVLAGYALLAGVIVPPMLARARWAYRGPGVAVMAWHGLMATFAISTALAVYHIVMTEQHVHDGLVGLLTACGLPAGAVTDDSAPTTMDAVLLLAPALVVLLPLGWFVRTVWRTRLAQCRHLDMLAVVGRPAPDYGATVVDHEIPAVYCLPGRSRRVVVTRRALEVLSADQLRAVLAHERAHIEGRHHLLHSVTEAFERAFPRLPLAGTAGSRPHCCWR